MPEIRVTPEQLEAAARQFESAARQFESMYRSLNNQMNQMTSQWRGVSKSAFYNDLSAWRRSMGPLPGRMRSISSGLKRTASEFRRADRS